MKQKKKIVVFFVVIIIFIYFFGLPTSKEEIQCKIKGNDWVYVPGLCVGVGKGYSCGYRCDIKTSDAGKKCYSNSECEGACLCSNNGSDSEGFLIGECSKYKNFTDVSDCPCIFESKSKNATFPYGCS